MTKTKEKVDEVVAAARRVLASQASLASVERKERERVLPTARHLELRRAAAADLADLAISVDGLAR